MLQYAKTNQKKAGVTIAISEKISIDESIKEWGRNLS